MPETPAPLMAALLVAARAVQERAKAYPREAAPYFMAAYNAIMDVVPGAAVWMWQVIKYEERVDQHSLDCNVCKPGELDCMVATRLKSKLLVFRARLGEAETWTKSGQ